MRMNMSCYPILKNIEKIKDAITEKNGARAVVDDMPYVIGLGMDCALICMKSIRRFLTCTKKSR